MGISRDHWHKRRATGGKRCPIRKKRKFELARPAAMTKLGPQRIHTVRVRGGNKKFRALRLDQVTRSNGRLMIGKIVVDPDFVKLHPFSLLLCEKPLFWMFLGYGDLYPDP
jgi:ribosomal protein S8E